jgi:hypothetical protein
LGWKSTGRGDITFGETEIRTEGDLVARPVDVGVVFFQPGDPEDYWVSSELGVPEGEGLLVRSDSEGQWSFVGYRPSVAFLAISH